MEQEDHSHVNIQTTKHPVARSKTRHGSRFRNKPLPPLPPKKRPTPITLQSTNTNILHLAHSSATPQHVQQFHPVPSQKPTPKPNGDGKRLQSAIPPPIGGFNVHVAEHETKTEHKRKHNNSKVDNRSTSIEQHSEQAKKEQ